MAALSRLLLSKGEKLLQNNCLLAKALPKNGIIRCMSEHRTLEITPSRWQWHKTKDWFHFYFLLGAIPAGLIIFCANVFVGPATLEAIPEDYIPKYWEYHRTPVTRFLSRYCFPNPQQEYEKYLHFIGTSYEYKEIRELQAKVKEMILHNQDYPAYYFRETMNPKYVKQMRESLDKYE